MPTKALPADRVVKRRRGPGDTMSAAMVNAQLRTMFLATLNLHGGIKYLSWLAKKHPGVFMQGLAKYMKPDDTGAAEGGLHIVVQQLNVIAAPTAGVINSPVLGDVPPPLKLAVSNGEVIDA